MFGARNINFVNFGIFVTNVITVILYAYELLRNEGAPS